MYKSNLLPFEVIEAATNGNIEALDKILKHFEGYIRKLSTRQLYDGCGNPRWCVDEELRLMLETTLVAKILKFDVKRGHSIKSLPTVQTCLIDEEIVKICT